MPRKPRHSIIIGHTVAKVINKKSTKISTSKPAGGKKQLLDTTLKAIKTHYHLSVDKSSARAIRGKLVKKVKKSVELKKQQQKYLKTQPNPIDSLRYEFACKNLTLSHALESTKENKQHKIQFGNYLIDTWFMSPYPPDFYTQSKFFICEFCFTSMKTASMAKRHSNKCFVKCPPGDEIYRQGKISIFEVDGHKNKVNNYALFFNAFTKFGSIIPLIIDVLFKFVPTD